MKIMQVNCTYRSGSTGKIMYDIHTHLKNSGYESFMCYGRGEDTQDEYVYRVCSNLYAKSQNLRSRISGLMYGGCGLSTFNLIRIIRKERPDIVHLHCINGYFVNVYRLLNWLKEHGQKTVLTLHAEFMYTANCGHAYDCEGWLHGCGKCPRRKEETLSWFLDRTSISWRKMISAYNGFENNLAIVSVSPWLMERAQLSPMLKNKKHFCVFNGVDTSIFCISDASGVRDKYAPNGEKIILFVTAFFTDRKDHPKGGSYLIELAKRLPHIKFLVAGDYEECDGLPENLILLGNVHDQNKLAELYSGVDLSLVLSKRETFSMPVAESMCCGTPVVGFCAGGPEKIAISEYSRFVKYGDIECLESLVCSFLNCNFDSSEISDKAANLYSSKIMAKSYLKIYRGLYES